jgi:BirA family biotin operon repressor/biotin-[acetyl-CoA-carboxylase] ligase
MAFALGSRAAEAGHRLAAYESLDSTNSTALALARSGERGPLWIVACMQTAGRGRRGRDWTSGEGDLATSLLISTHVAPAVAATLGFVAGLALDEALRSCAPGAEVRLKWPNDVILGNAKLAGILLDAENGPNGLTLVVGIGVNLATAPRGLPFPATSLAASGFIVHPEQMFAALTEAWIGFEHLWDGGCGMPHIRDLWLAKAAGRGKPVSVTMGDRVVQGIFETLDENGRLILRRPDRSEIAIAAGEVHFGRAATLHEPAKDHH